LKEKTGWDGALLLRQLPFLCVAVTLLLLLRILMCQLPRRQRLLSLGDVGTACARCYRAAVSDGWQCLRWDSYKVSTGADAWQSLQVIK
jgi:hypothetical protein